jgi:hypothetical protein
MPIGRADKKRGLLADDRDGRTLRAGAAPPLLPRTASRCKARRTDSPTAAATGGGNASPIWR